MACSPDPLSLYDRLPDHSITADDILEEERLGEMETLAQLVQAEAGNQGLEGMRLVAEVVINRTNHPNFPDTISEVIFQKGQFGVITDGAFERAGWNMTPEAFEAARLAMEEPRDSEWLYFNDELMPFCDDWKFKNHYFGR